MMPCAQVHHLLCHMVRAIAGILPRVLVSDLALIRYRSGRARKLVFLILKYYLGLATCTDSYIVIFFAPPVETILELYFVNYLELCVPLLK